MEKIDKLNILYKSKVIKEMTLEDLEIWEGFEKIYPFYLRFPESVEWNWNSTLRNRKKLIKELNQSTKRVKGYIDELLGIKVFRAKSDKQLCKFMKEQKKMLNIHLKKLKEIRDKRLNEKIDVIPKSKLKKMNKALSNSSPSVRTSNSTSLTSDKPKGFNMGLEVPTSSPPKSNPTDLTSPNPNIMPNSCGELQVLSNLNKARVN